MLQGEHSAILLTFIKLPSVIKIFVLSIFEWPFYTGFTVLKVKAIQKCFCVKITRSLQLKSKENGESLVGQDKKIF